MPELHTLRGLLSTRPAVRVMLPLVAGIWAAEMLPATPTHWYALVLAFSSVSLILRQYPGSRHWMDVSLVALFMCCGGASSATRTVSAFNEVWQPISQNERVSVRGRIVAPPVRSAKGWRMVVDVDSVASAIARSQSSTMLAHVRTSKDSVPPPKAGQLVAATGLVEQFPRPRNPGEFDYGAYLMMGGISGVLTVDTLRVVGTGAPEISTDALLGIVQEELYRIIDALHSGDRSAFLKGVILGYRSELSEDLKQAFLTTGTVHILAVSGGNVALIAMVGMVIFSFLRVGRKTLLVLGIGAILLYMWATGSSPSVVRATLMGGLVLAAGVLNRRPDVYQSIGVAALVLLLWDPWYIRDVGFQLSFLSVISIIVGVERVEQWMERMPEEVRTSKSVRTVVQLMAITFVAQVGTLPLTIQAFGQLSLIAVLANLAVVPLSGLVLIIGVIELILSPVSIFIAGVYATVNDLAMDLLLGLVRAASNVPHASIAVSRWDSTEILCAYLLLITFAGYRVIAIRRFGVLAVVFMLNVIVWRGIVERAESRLEYVAVDIGQGDAHILRFPSGKVMMIDTGPSPERAERAILPLMDRLGIDALETLVLTHDHADHVGGASVLLDRIPVRTLIVSASSRLQAPVEQAAAKMGCSIRRVGAGDRIDIDENSRVWVLGPGVSDSLLSTNNRSIVLKVQTGETSMLLMGDAEKGAEAILLRRFGSFLQSDVLKVGHHGSRTGTTEEMLAAVRPAVGVISSGWRNSFGHPSREKVETLRRFGVQVFGTATDRAIWMRSDGARWNLIQW